MLKDILEAARLLALADRHQLVGAGICGECVSGCRCNRPLRRYRKNSWPICDGACGKFRVSSRSRVLYPPTPGRGHFGGRINFLNSFSALRMLPGRASACTSQNSKAKTEFRYEFMQSLVSSPSHVLTHTGIGCILKISIGLSII